MPARGAPRGEQQQLLPRPRARLALDAEQRVHRHRVARLAEHAHLHAHGCVLTAQLQEHSLEQHALARVHHLHEVAAPQLLAAEAVRAAREHLAHDQLRGARVGRLGGGGAPLELQQALVREAEELVPARLLPCVQVGALVAVPPLHLLLRTRPRQEGQREGGGGQWDGRR
eukprot:CAMPEP_0180085682 /NCGR_PEP_ID=MMETSP0985-20121206/20595_1 /TAXON_ID=483367 /ORGANISM="non described non described, Strain CCMP 2436" /LENGTH=170 /DNA_ID=CAMNT_0022019567 /DNA_START=100 /DNA_END=608 /DNA_ORIENTATION=-